MMVNKLYVAVFALLLLSSATALLNTKDYDSITDTITIKDWLGLSDYETIKFTSEKYGLTDMEVVQEITPAQSITSKEAFGKIEFINKAGKDWANKKITYKVQYEVTETIKVKEDVWGTCKKDIPENKTSGEKAKQDVEYDCVTGTKDFDKQKTTLKDFWDLNKLEAKKTYIVHVTAHKNPTTPATDWIAEYGGLAVKEKAWWDTDWTKCKDITLTTGQAWTDGIAVVNITGLSGTITGLEIVNSDCKNDGTAINRTILHNGSNSAYVTFLADGTNPTYSVYYAPTGSYTNSPNATYFYDDFEDGSYSDKWVVSYGTALETNGYLKIGTDNSRVLSAITDMNYALMWFDMSQDDDDATTFGFYNPTDNTLRHIGESRSTKSNNPATSVAWSGNSNLRHNYTIKWTATAVNGTQVDTPYGATTTTTAWTNGMGVDIEYGYLAESYQYVYDIKIYPFYANLYADGTTKFTLGAEETNSVPMSVTLNAPVNYYNTSTASQSFNCSSTAGTGYNIQNITLYLYKADSTITTDTTSYGTDNNATKVTTASGTDGDNKWNCFACDDLNCSFATTNRTFMVDTINPDVYYENGTSAFVSKGSAINSQQNINSITINITAYDLHFANMTFTMGNSTIFAVVYQNTTDSSNFYQNYTGLIDETYTLSTIAWDNFGNHNHTLSGQISIDATQPNIYFGTGTASANQTSTTVVINVSASDTNLANITIYFYKDGIIKYTNITTSANLYWAILSQTDGTYSFNATARDTYGNSNSTETRTVLIDTTAPTIDLISPINNTVYTFFNAPLYNVTFNFSTADVGVGLNVSSSCRYHYDTGGTTLYTCNELFAKNKTTGGWHRMQAIAQDALGNGAVWTEDSGNATRFFLNYVVDGTPVYTSPIAEDAMSNPITFSMSATSVTSFTGFIVYNKTAYTTTVSFNSTTGTLYANPLESSSGDKEFYYNYTVNGINHLTANYTQLRMSITPPLVTSAACGDLNRTATYNLIDEENRTAVFGATINYNFQYGILNSSKLIENGTIVLSNATNTFNICINGTIGNYTFNYGELQYFKAGYSDNRYYIFKGIVMNPANIITASLSLLPSIEATSFLFTFTDAQLNIYTNVYAALMRWYPEINQYNIVSMMKTDNKGQSIARVHTEDVDYRVALYQLDGTLIYLASPVRFACLTAPCSYTLQIPNVASLDYANEYRIQNSLTWNETTGVFTFIWNDPTLTTDSMQLEVIKVGGSRDVMVCNSTATGYTGVLSCNVAPYTSGTFRAVAYRTSSHSNPIASALASLATSSAFQNSFGLLIAALIIMFAGLLGIYNPVASVILATIALIPIAVFNILGTFGMAIMFAFAVLMAVAIHLFKKVS